MAIHKHRIEMARLLRKLNLLCTQIHPNNKDPFDIIRREMRLEEMASVIGQLRVYLDTQEWSTRDALSILRRAVNGVRNNWAELPDVYKLGIKHNVYRVTKNWTYITN